MNYEKSYKCVCGYEWVSEGHSLCDVHCPKCQRVTVQHDYKVTRATVAELFNCPNCGEHRLEEVMENVTVASQLVQVREDGDIDYGEQTNEDGDVVRFQCVNCGQFVRDGAGKLIT